MSRRFQGPCGSGVRASIRNLPGAPVSYQGQGEEDAMRKRTGKMKGARKHAARPPAKGAKRPMGESPERREEIEADFPEQPAPR
jgi:hypothetical protein